MRQKNSVAVSMESTASDQGEGLVSLSFIFVLEYNGVISVFEKSF